MACSIWASIRFFKHGLRRRNLFERKLAIFLVQLLEAIETVAAVSHHLAGLGHAAQLLGQLQQADLGFDDFLFRRHSGLSILRRRL